MTALHEAMVCPVLLYYVSDSLSVGQKIVFENEARAEQFLAWGIDYVFTHL